MTGERLVDRLCVWADGEGNSGLPGDVRIEVVDDRIRIEVTRGDEVFWTFIPADNWEEMIATYIRTRGVTVQSIKFPRGAK